MQYIYMYLFYACSRVFHSRVLFAYLIVHSLVAELYERKVFVSDLLLLSLLLLLFFFCYGLLMLLLLFLLFLLLLLLLFALSFRFCSLFVVFLCCVIIDTQVKQINKQACVDKTTVAGAGRQGG